MRGAAGRGRIVLTRASGRLGDVAGVPVVGIDAVDGLAADIRGRVTSAQLSRAAFLDPDAYRPLPTLVEAARELHGKRLASAHRTGYRRDRANAPIRLERRSRGSRAHGPRHLVLLSGLPGTGKTLVGLQLAHARFLDDLAIERIGGKPTAPAVYLSGNGPLVEVLQYELRDAGGGGRAFVRAVKAYVETYSRRAEAVPPEHVLIFDEAQRAHSTRRRSQKFTRRRSDLGARALHRICGADPGVVRRCWVDRVGSRNSRRRGSRRGPMARGDQHFQ